MHTHQFLFQAWPGSLKVPKMQNSVNRSVVRMYPQVSYFSYLSDCWMILNQPSKVSLFPQGFFLFFLFFCCPFWATQGDFQFFFSIANRVFFTKPANLARRGAGLKE